MEHINTSGPGVQKHAEKPCKEPTKKEHTKAVDRNEQKDSANKRYLEDDREHKDFMQVGCPGEPSNPDVKDPADQKQWRIFVLKQKMQSLETTHVLYRVSCISFFNFQETDTIIGKKDCPKVTT